MTLVEGESLGTIIQRALTASGTSSASGFSAKAAAAMKTSGGNAVDGAALIGKLIETFGVQIFTLGKFHSDPHPGNLLVRPDGKTLSVIDFGQTKELDTDTRLSLARITLALAADERDAALSEIKNLGVNLQNASDDFAMKCAYILFDTRMDIEEAHLSHRSTPTYPRRCESSRSRPYRRASSCSYASWRSSAGCSSPSTPTFTRE